MNSLASFLSVILVNQCADGFPRECTYGRMELNTLEIGKTISMMVTVRKSGPTVINILAIGKRTESTEKESTYGPLVIGNFSIGFLCFL